MDKNIKKKSLKKEKGWKYWIPVVGAMKSGKDLGKTKNNPLGYGFPLAMVYWTYHAVSYAATIVGGGIGVSQAISALEKIFQ